MAVRLDQDDSDFDARFAALLAAKREVSEDVEAVARRIVEDVRRNGDAALIDHTARLDGVDLNPATIAVSHEEFAAAEQAVAPEALAALLLARDRIEAYHARQMPRDDRYTDPLGVELGSRWTAIEAVGLYVPGGTAAYPSSVLMNAVPAKVAGVERIVMVSPTQG
ncbi:MAG: histidinol dehydrogenase, partial [Rhizobiales bacterium]|nr:histidinol dehydrogenase [Hyphomicrobiales bacterium]